MQAGIFATRAWAQSLDNKVLFKVDIRNAYNTISRHACCEVADAIDNDLATWTRWCLASPSMVACNVASLSCTTGVQQGEPLSPLLFCAGLAPLTQAVADYFPQVKQLWYLDDGLLYGDAAHVSACLVLI